jgi:hypothetical protein
VGRWVQGGEQPVHRLELTAVLVHLVPQFDAQSGGVAAQSFQLGLETV